MNKLSVLQNLKKVYAKPYPHVIIENALDEDIFLELKSTLPESYVSNRLEQEFWNKFYTELKSWDSSQMKDNDLKVYKAIIILFESKEDIEIFNKKAIYLYLREITGLNTKQIVNSLKKFRKKYFLFKDDWENGQL